MVVVDVDDKYQVRIKSKRTGTLVRRWPRLMLT